MEALCLILRKNSEAGESAEDAIKGARMCPNGLGQLLAMFWPVAKEIGNAELCHHGEQLRDLGPMDHVQQRHGWWRLVGRVRIIWWRHRRPSLQSVKMRQVRLGQTSFTRSLTPPLSRAWKLKRSVSWKASAAAVCSARL